MKKIFHKISPLFIFLVFSVVGFAAPTNFTFDSQSLTLTSNIGCNATTYTFSQKTANDNNAKINTSASVIINFPTGTDASTFSGGTFNGTAISDETATATQISFSAPVAVGKKTTFSIVLNGITNGDDISGNCTISIVNGSGGDDTGTYAFTTTACACAVPSSLTSSSVTASTATISWTAASPAPSNGYQYEVRTSGAAGSGATGLVTSGTTAAGIVTKNITGLSANTTYYVYVRSDCGSSDYSDWTAAYDFTTICTPPTTQATIGSYTNITTTSLTANWTGGNGDNTLVVARLTSTSAVAPTSGTSYTANTAFGSGNTTGTGNFVVYNGTGTTVDVTGLSSATNYTFDIYEYLDTDVCYKTPASSGAVTTACTPPSTQATIGSYTNNTSGSSLTVNWTGGNGDETIVVARLTSTSSVDPSNGTTYTDNTVFGSGDITGTGNFVVYAGTGTSVAVTGLTANTSYTFTVYEYSTSGPCYNTSGSSSAVTTFNAVSYCNPSGNSSSYFIDDFSTTNGVTNITNNNSDFSTGGYGDFTGQSASQIQNSSVNFSISNDGGSYTYGFAIWIDWDQDGSFETSELAYSTTSYATDVTGSFTVPLTATVGNTRMRVKANYLDSEPEDPCATSISGEFEDYTFTVIATTPCSGTPAPGSTVASSNPVCSGVTFDLSLSNTFAVSGITYQWQSSPDGSTWTDISGETSATLSTSQTAETYYRCKVTCTNGGGNANSTAVDVTMETPSNCYCDPSGNSSSYFIDDFSTTGGSTNITNNSSGFSTGGYGDFTGQSASQVQNSSINFSISNDGGTYTYGFAIWIDWNQDGSFETSELVYSTTSYETDVTGSFTVPLSATVGDTRMRVKANYSDSEPEDPCATTISGEFEDYTFTVIATTPCSGTPAPGNTVASSNPVCSGVTFDLSLSNTFTVSGITYQWQSSPDGSTWTDISGETSATLSTSQTAETYYRCKVTCTNGGGNANSTAVDVTMETPSNCYCDPSGNSSSYFIEDFSTTGGVTDITNNGSGFSTGGYGDFTGQSASQVQNSSINFSISNDGGTYTYGFAIWIDWDQSGSFETSELVYSTTSYATDVTGSFTVPLSATVGDTRMRVKANYSDSEPEDPCATTISGEFEDYTFTVIATTPCSGTPAPGNTVASSNPVCSGVLFDLSLSNTFIVSGITYQWQSSPDGSTWTDISGETSETLSTSQTVETYYQCIVSCTNSGFSTISTAVDVTMESASNCYCEPSGNSSSYFIDDFSTTGGFTNITNNNSGFSTGGYGDFTGQSASQVQNSSINFSISNDGGTYTYGFAIWIDWDQSGSFETSELVYSTTSYATDVTGSFTVPLSATSGNTRMRVKANYTDSEPEDPCATSISGEFEDYTFTVIALADCSGEPNAGTASISSSSGCSNASFTITTSGLTAASGITFQWQSSANGSTSWADISGATGTSYSTTVDNTTYYRLVTTCSFSSQSNYSNVVSYTVTGNDCVCGLYSENHTNYYTTDEDIGNVTVGSLDNTSSLGDLASGDGSEAYIYSNYTGIVSAPDLQQLASISFSLSSIISSGSYDNGFQIYIDYDHDGIFETSEQAYSSASAVSGAHTETGNFVIPITAETGITRMRVICMQASFPTSTNYAETTPYDYGETEDYCVNITPAPDCSGTPNAGTASIDLSSGCLSTQHTVSATGLTAATGITYQWQSSLDGSTGWTDILDADDASYTTMTDVTTYYRLETTCANSGLSDQTNVVSYTVDGADCCVSTLNLYDDGGDGWDGGSVSVSVGGVVYGNYTLNSGSGPETIYITSDADEAISIVYTDGTDYDENYFDLIGPDNTYYAEDWYPTDSYSWYDGPWNGRGCPIPQQGEMCEMSIAFCTGTNYSFPTGVDNPPAPDGPEYGCLYSQPNPIYYYLRVDQPGAMQILIESDCGDVDYAAWGPFDATTCDPSDLTADGNPGTGGNYDQAYGNLVDCAYSTAAIEYLDIPDAQAGEYYMIMINNYANCDGIINFEQVDGDGSSDCTIVAPPVSNNGPYCVGQDIELSVNYPVTGATYAWTGPNSFTSSDMNPTITNADPDDSGTYSLIITVEGVDSDAETTEVIVSNPEPLTTVSTGDFVFRNIGSNWNVASNWLECTGTDTYTVSSIIPTVSDHVIICAGTTCSSNDAIIETTNAVCNSLTIEAGCLLTMQGSHNLTVYSNWTNNGTYEPGTGTVIFNGNTTISGTTSSHDFHNITINATKTLTAPADNINMYGDWLNNGTFSHNSGTITFLGTSDQNITSGVTSSFYNLTIQNTATGVNILDNTTVLNTLALNDGILTTGANYIIPRGLTSSAITGFSDQSFIYGNLRKYIDNGVTYPLPVGKGTNSTDYLRADIISNISGGTSYIDVSVNSITENSNNVDANLSTTQNAESITEVLGEDAIWTISPDLQPTGTYGIRLYVANIGLDAGDDNFFCIVKRGGASTNYSDWLSLDGSTTIPANDAAGRIYNSGNGYAERDGYTSFSQFSIAKWTSTLPVELVSFKGICKNNSAILSWQTSSEINNDYFILEKSKNMKEFFEITRVNGAGNSNDISTYEFIDNDIFSVDNYYRLKQVNFNGKCETFNTILINCDKNNHKDSYVSIYPNPFRSQINLYVENLNDQDVELIFLDETGRIVCTQKYHISSNVYETSIDLNALRPTMYNLRVITNDDVYNIKITKQ